MGVYDFCYFFKQLYVSLIQRSRDTVSLTVIIVLWLRNDTLDVFGSAVAKTTESQPEEAGDKEKY